MASYEKQRSIRIEQNKARMNEMGIPTMAYEARCKVQNHKKGKTRKVKDIDEYRPDEEDERSQSSEGDASGSHKIVRNLRSCSNRVMGVRGGSKINNVDELNMSMADLVKMRPQPQKNNQQQSQKVPSKSKHQQVTNLQQDKAPVKYPEGKQYMRDANVIVEANKQQQRTSAPIKGNQLEKHAHAESKSKRMQSKTLVAPGSLSSYAKMREKMREQERRDVLLKNATSKAITDQGFQSRDTGCGIESSLEKDCEDHGSDCYASESDCYESSEGEENGYTENMGDCAVNELSIAENQQLLTIQNQQEEPMELDEQQIEKPVVAKPKRKRGPSMCKDVHGRSITERQVIILNERGEPIGPNKKTLVTFSHFLGSLARDAKLAPLNKLNWHRVSGKDKIWDYVKKKYIIAEAGKTYVLRRVGALWRSHKSRVKGKHYHGQNDIEQMLENQPTSVPSAQFKELLEYWELPSIKKISEDNKKKSEDQKDRHTMGPTSFARKRYELEKAIKKTPSQALMYKETRKRKEGKDYETPYDPIQKNIDQMEKIQAEKDIGGDDAYYAVFSKRNPKQHRLPNKSESNSKSGVLIPDEFLQPYRTQIVKDTVSEVMKLLGQQLPAETLAVITPSFGNLSNCGEHGNNDLVGQSSQHTNNEELEGEQNKDCDMDGDDNIASRTLIEEINQ